MGRKKAYEPAEALRRMMMVFWERGFHATSVSHLEAATGVDRKGLFAAYGNKESMFRAALGLYADVKAAPDGAPLGREPLGPDNVRRFFQAIRYDPENELGCLMALTILERESVPPDAYEMSRGLYAGLEQAIAANLTAAVGPDEARSLGRYFVNALFGIIVSGRAGATNDDLRDVVRRTLSVLP